ncbi:MAG: sugar transferase [Oscillospiraceae bacterium]|jgi:exopolysaccharide biosynthesis polyprenyl glycosylphosphotransferase|nr:sugar transferase [Oscillospiraceae bacterium]MDD3260371.1 sugar transferase [Oscillospiraceae bacterium]
MKSVESVGSLRNGRNYKKSCERFYRKTESRAEQKKQGCYLFVKRTADIVFSLLAMALLSPLLLAVAIAIRFDSPGPAIFVQERIGKNKKHFRMYKFRSMCGDAEQKLQGLQGENERDGPAFKLSNDPRVTKIGKILRQTCIDELPQLVNILKGDMSLVGPRPPLPEEVEQYTAYQCGRLQVKPGLTCYWQIQKGKVSTFDDWVNLDLQYIKERSLRLDLKLILKTVAVVLWRKGEE